ncbi:MAG: hypothetical protein BA864_12910 [Desulfuromonadales bacterium C00003093]|nr:MAG: hypothetical protein BA864_12910 [Desulfuromonadales bacterium C00003093]
MKKETLLFVAIALVVGVLLGIIFSNAKRDKQPTATAPAAAPVPVPAVNYPQQITMLEGIVAKEPENRNAWIQLGHNYFDSDQPMRAVEAYDKALKIEGNDANILTDQGVMYRRLGWFDKAIKNFEQAYRLNPKHQQSLYNLGVVYRYDLQDFPKAVEIWEKFLVINSGGPGAAQVQSELEFLKNHPQTPQPRQ